MNDKNKQLFFSLIYNFQMQAMMHLGKLPNPITNKIEKELEGAQVTIDMLDMLKDKTKNNLEDDEKKFLEQVVADLKLNYVDERDKPEVETTSSDKKKTDETTKKEKPLNELIKEDDNPLPPQE